MWHEIREQEIATELMETRVNGYHARWPRDPDTTERLERLGEERPSRFPLLHKIWMFISEIEIPRFNTFPWIIFPALGILIIALFYLFGWVK